MENITETTIKTCFCKAGISCSDFLDVSHVLPAVSDPFSDIDSYNLDQCDDGG